MFKSKIFTTWYFSALTLWVVLFSLFDSILFFLGHWYYAAMMVGGAFVAGFTPEGGGAVAFPVLSVFLKVDRVLARDFSMMIQSIGMTSASVFILTQAQTRVRDYRPLFGLVPVALIGTTLGFLLLQKIPVYIIQAMFLSLSATFVIAYYLSDHRGTQETVNIESRLDLFYLGLVLVLGGMISSLFGTGADVVLYLLLITHFNMTAKKATRISIVLQAAISLFGFSYRAFIDQGLTSYQIKTWLCAFPVVLFMAPFGVYVLSRLHVNWMLRAIILLNLFQLAYFNLKEPSIPKLTASLIFCGALAVIFYFMLRRMAGKHREANQRFHAAEAS
ncbi:MAG TPA: sulfite exporter TauE/SafE family protein [Fimbriimonadaceae bacterium]|nr:sulfite exporter TauE/SafE family protein [Fimbriimonadaceae bacterium]